MSGIDDPGDKIVGAVNHKCSCCDLQGKFKNNLCNECHASFKEILKQGNEPKIQGLRPDKFIMDDVVIEERNTKQRLKWSQEASAKASSSEYEAGYKQAQLDIRRALGLFDGCAASSNKAETPQGAVRTEHTEEEK